MSDPARRDARRNRDALMRAARQVFKDQGVDAPMTTIARRAGLSSATLYRHFPAREALIAELFAGDMHTCVRMLDDAVAEPDARHGLETVLSGIAELQTEDPAFADAFLRRLPAMPEFDALRVRAEQGLAHLVSRAKRAGSLRPDFAVSDVFIILFANRGLAGMPADTKDAASRRLTALLLDACFGDRSVLPPELALTLGRLDLADAPRRLASSSPRRSSGR